MAVTLAGLIAAPFTLGISLAVTSIVGASLGIAGSLTTIGTSIADCVIESGDKKAVTELLEAFKYVESQFLERLSRMMVPVSYVDRVTLFPTFGTYFGFGSCRPQLVVDNGDKGTDELVSIRDLKEGDHIFRPIQQGFNIVHHHGVCIMRNNVLSVIDFGQKLKETNQMGGEVGIKSMATFCTGLDGNLRRRNYHGNCFSTEETIQLAKCAILGNIPGFEMTYNLFANNCEHFATFLKQGVPRSRQVRVLANVGTGVKYGVKPVQHTLEVAESIGTLVARVSAPVPGFFDDILLKPFMAAPAITGMSTASKVCIVLGPIGTALDIGMLVYDWKKDKTNVAMIKANMERLVGHREQTSGFVEELNKYIKVIEIRQNKQELAKTSSILPVVQQKWKLLRDVRDEVFCHIFFFFLMVVYYCLNPNDLISLVKPFFSGRKSRS